MKQAVRRSDEDETVSASGPRRLAVKARPEPGASPRPWRDRALLTALAALLFLPALGSHDLWNPDEPRYAEVAREMRTNGDYLVPHLNGEVYAHKPPLFFWCISLAAALTGGVDELSARLPSALSGIGAVLLVFSLGERFFGRRTAWYAAAAFGACAAILHQATVGQIDMLLVFLVTLAVDLWSRGYVDRRREPSGGSWSSRAFFAVAGLATLAKGPVGLLPPLLSIVAFLLWTRDRAELRRLRIGRGLLLWAAIVGAWLLPAAMSAEGDYLRRMTIDQNLLRYVSPDGTGLTRGHLHPWYYYLIVTPLFFLPWSAFLPAGIRTGVSLRGRERRGFLLAACWVAVTLLFFSLSPAKRHVYVLTMVPALALIAGLGLARTGAALGGSRRWIVIPTAVIALLTAIPVALVSWPGGVAAEYLPAGRSSVPGLLPLLAILPAAALVALALALRGRVPAMAAVLTAGLALVAIGGRWLFLPELDAIKSPRAAAELLRSRLREGEEYATLGICPQCIFYVGRSARALGSVEEARAWAATTDRPWLLALRGDLPQLEGLPLAPVTSTDVRPRSYVLLGPAP